jgi:hypothetical protein
MTTLHLRKSIDRSPLRLGFLLIPLALTLFALSPMARAEDGGLPNDSTAEGINALVNQNNSGFGNTAMGWNALGVLTGASFNTATGYKALLNNNGDNNTADGSQALANNTNGTWNTATGANPLLSNTTGSVNTALGYSALSSNTNDGDNIVIGYPALASNGFDGTDNTAIGAGALFSNISGGFNTAIGFNALSKNTGSNNTAVGDQALVNNTNGTENTATGTAALLKNTSGNNNTAPRSSYSGKQHSRSRQHCGWFPSAREQYNWLLEHCFGVQCRYQPHDRQQQHRHWRFRYSGRVEEDSDWKARGTDRHLYCGHL